MARVQITPPHIAMMGIGCPTNQPVLDTLNPTQRLSIVNGYNRLKALPGGTVINRIELIDDQPHIQVDFHYEPRGQWGEHQSWSIPLGRREEEKAMHRLFRSNPSFTLPLSSVGAYKTIADVISDLNVMICEAPLTGDVARKLADVVGSLQATQKVSEDVIVGPTEDAVREDVEVYTAQELRSLDLLRQVACQQFTIGSPPLDD